MKTCVWHRGRRGGEARGGGGRGGVGGRREGRSRRAEVGEERA